MSSQPYGHLVKQTVHLACLCLSKPEEAKFIFNQQLDFHPLFLFSTKIEHRHLHKEITAIISFRFPL